MASNYAHLENCDLSRDFALALAPDGTAAAYGRLSWEVDDEGCRRFEWVLNVHPTWERPDFLAVWLAWFEARAQEMARALPPANAQVLQAFVRHKTHEAVRVQVMEATGYAAARFGYLMRRDLADPIAEPTLPAGLTVRPPANEAEIRQVFAALDEAFRDHWGHAPLTEMTIRAILAEPDFSAALWQVAWAGDDVAASVHVNIPVEENRALNQAVGWTDPIAVRRPWRKQGLAWALLLRGLHVLRAQGITHALLGVDTQNPNGALNLHLSCGFAPVQESITLRKPLVV